MPGSEARKRIFALDVPGHPRPSCVSSQTKTWMAGTSPAMTAVWLWSIPNHQIRYCLVMISPSLALSANELLDEFMHAVLEDVVPYDLCLEAIADARGALALRSALAAHRPRRFWSRLRTRLPVAARPANAAGESLRIRRSAIKPWFQRFAIDPVNRRSAPTPERRIDVH